MARVDCLNMTGLLRYIKSMLFIHFVLVMANDKTCGNPPSFPHTILHGHTGFEMGDELLYICSQGYIMERGASAFTLLCDNCGKWYGHVQACIKDETEFIVDYEVSFHDDNDMPDMEYDDDDDDDDGVGGGESHMEQLEKGNKDEIYFTKNNDQVDHLGDEIFPFIDEARKESTESQFSMLSPKHFFKLHPKAFSEYEFEMDPYDTTKNQFVKNDNHIEIKIDYSKPVNWLHFDSRDFSNSPFIDDSNKNTSKDTTGSINSNPVTLVIKDGETVDSPKDTDDISVTTNQTSNFEVNNTDVTTPETKHALNQIVSASALVMKSAITEEEWFPPSIILEDISINKGFKDNIEGYYQAPHVLSTEEPTFHVTESIPSITSFPGSTQEVSMYSAISEAKLNIDQYSKSFVEERSEETHICEPYLVCYCLKDSNSQCIVFSLVILCLLFLSVMVAIWCYKRRRKRSFYSFKDQTRNSQEIEMQKV